MTRPHFIGETASMPKSVCLGCGAPVDAATVVDEKQATPEPGDVTVCLNCGHLQAFADDLSLRELTDQEMHDVAGDERILVLQKARGKAMQHDHHCRMTYEKINWRIVSARGPLLALRSEGTPPIMIVVDTSGVDWPAYCEAAAQMDKAAP